jgi:hypothetical protein
MDTTMDTTVDINMDMKWSDAHPACSDGPP